MIREYRERLTTFIDTLERSHISPARWLLALSAIIVLRHFLEQVSGQLHTIPFLAYFLHYPLAYLAPMLALSVVLAVMAHERVERVTKLMLFAWLLTLLPPVLDLMLSSGHSDAKLIGYLLADGPELGRAFINLLNPAYGMLEGTTTGIRLEAGVGCVLAAVYVHVKTRNAWRALLTLPVVYVTMFFFFSLPSLTYLVSRWAVSLGLDAGAALPMGLNRPEELFMTQASVYRAFTDATPGMLLHLSTAIVDLFVLIPVLKAWYWLHDREGFRSVYRRIDIPTTGLHLVATIAGIVLGARLLLGSGGLVSVAHPFDALALVALIVASMLTAQTASWMRRWSAREEAGSVTDGAVPDRVGWTQLALALLLAASVSHVALTYVLATLAVYALYYAPPFELRRFTPLAGLLIGAIVLFSVGLGFSAYAGTRAAIWLPRSIVTLAVLGPALAFVARDVWDRRAADVPWSLSLVRVAREPVVRAVAGGGVLLASLLPAVVLREPAYAVPGAVVGIVGLVALLRLRPARIPGAVGGLGLVLLVALLAMGLPLTPVLVSDLTSTSFAQTSRRSSSYSLVDKSAASEQQRLVNDGLLMMNPRDPAVEPDLEGAILNFRRAIELEPDYVHAYISLGSAQLRAMDIEGAERSFRRAIELEGENALALVGLAQTYMLFDQVDEAIRYAERALEIDPQSVDAAYTLALIYQSSGDVEKEVDALIRTAQIEPRHGQALSRLADIYLENERYEQAVQALRAAQAGAMRVQHIHTRLAGAYYAMGDLDAAETELRREVEVSPRSASAQASLARLLAERGQMDEARTRLRRAIELAQDQQLKLLLEQELERIGG